MTNYNESQAQATLLPYRRVRYIGISNPPTGLPVVQVLEADAVVLNGRKIHLDESVGGMTIPFDLSAGQRAFPLRNPLTDEILPDQTANGFQLQVLLYSWSRSYQVERDGGPVLPDPTPAPQVNP